MFLEPWKIHGISTTNLPQLFVRSPDLDKIPQEAVVHEIKDSSTGKKDLQRMAEWEGQGFLRGWEFSTGWCGMDFLCPAIFQKIEKLRMFFIYVEFLLIEVWLI